MVHSSRDLRNLRIAFSAFDEESAVHDYKWTLMRNDYHFERSGADGKLQMCTEFHAEECEQGPSYIKDGKPHSNSWIAVSDDKPAGGGSEQIDDVELTTASYLRCTPSRTTRVPFKLIARRRA